MKVKVKKFFTLIASVLFISIVPAFSNVSAIKTEQLPQDEEFQQRFRIFQDDYKFITPFGAALNSTVPEEILVSDLKKFYNYINQLKKTENETQLVKFLVESALYNVNQLTGEQVEKDFSKISKLLQKDYRLWWFYGNYKSSRETTVSNFSIYKKAIELAGGLNAVHQDFLMDYAGACTSLQLYQNALNSLKLYASRTAQPADSLPLYKIITENLLTPAPDTDYQSSQIWNVAPQEDGFNIFSTFLGISFKSKKSWNLKTTGISKNSSFAIINPEPAATSSGAKINSIFLVSITPKDMTPNQLEYKTNSMIKGYTVDKTYSKKINGHDFTIYECSNPYRYNNDIQQGAKLLFAAAQIPYNPESGLNVEQPVPLQPQEDSENNVQFFTLQKHFTRTSQTVTVFFSLDTCTAIWSKSKKLFENFIKDVVLE